MEEVNNYSTLVQNLPILIDIKKKHMSPGVVRVVRSNLLKWNGMVGWQAYTASLMVY